MTHMEAVGVRELRQNLSKYLERVKRGEDLVVTERGVEVARLVRSGPRESVIDRLVRERGATRATRNIDDLDWDSPPPYAGPSSQELLNEQREERF